MIPKLIRLPNGTRFKDHAVVKVGVDFQADSSFDAAQYVNCQSN